MIPSSFLPTLVHPLSVETLPVTLPITQLPLLLLIFCSLGMRLNRSL